MRDGPHTGGAWTTPPSTCGARAHLAPSKVTASSLPRSASTRPTAERSSSGDARRGGSACRVTLKSTRLASTLHIHAAMRTPNRRGLSFVLAALHLLSLTLCTSYPTEKALVQTISERVATINIQAQLSKLREGTAQSSEEWSQTEEVGWIRVPLNHFVEDPKQAQTGTRLRTLKGTVPIDLRFPGDPQYTEENTLLVRYFVNRQYLDSSEESRPFHKQPAFLALGGENARHNAGEWPLVYSLAAKYHALVVGIEHRFFGESVPPETNGGSLESSKLLFLDPEQAIADVVHLLAKLNSGADGKQGADNHRGYVWIAFGCSYAGSLAAWAQARFPELIRGAIATSAPTYAKLEFPELDQHVQAAFRKEKGAFAPGGNKRAAGRCAPALQAALATYDELIDSSESSATRLKKMWMLPHPDEFNNDDFRYFLADLAAMSVQNGNRHRLCNCLEAEVCVWDQVNNKQQQCLSDLNRNTNAAGDASTKRAKEHERVTLE
eukprot:scaffold175_cov414-Prasinococcus_capsulatus_cf.AAC.46